MGARRAGAVAVVAGVLVLAGLPRADARAVPDQEPLTGTASGTAVVAKVIPGVGAFPTGLASGVALSNVTNAIAQAQAETLDLGLLALLLTSYDLVDGDDLPQELFVDNRAGDAAADHDQVPIDGTTFGGGRKSVRATKAVPSASASSTLASAFDDVLEVQAGRAESRSEVLPEQGHQARASVSLDLSIAGGLVRLSGLRWDALHRSGDGARSEGSFGLREASVGGVPIPVDSLAAVEAAANEALAPLGLSLQLPKVQRLKEPVDLVRVTSLRIMFKDSSGRSSSTS
jgi:hypothetical protein